MEEIKYILNDDLDMLQHPVGSNLMENIPLIEIMAKEFTQISEYRNKRVNIICRGSSGAIIGAIFSQKIPNEYSIAHVKKPGEDSHSNFINLWEENSINIIIDDFISSGNTLNAIWDRMIKKDEGFKVHCVIVGGSAKAYKLNFVPDYFICQNK